MKKVLVLLFAVLATNCVSAQNYGNDYKYSIKGVWSDDGMESREFFYDADNILVNSYWINDRNGNPDVQDTLSYDENHNVIRRAKYQPSYGTNWYMVSYCDYTYNEIGQRITRKNYNYDNGGYKLGGTYTYSYDAEGRLIHWDLELGTVGAYQNCDYTYDADGNCILEMTYQYDSWYGSWVDAYKLEYSYDYSGRLVEMKGFYPNNGGWIESSHKVWLRNQEGNVTIEYSYDGENVIEQHEYEYDMDLLTEEVLPRVNPENEWPVLPLTKNVIVKDKYSSRQGGNLQLVCEYDYQYNVLISDVAGNAISDLKVYPNPAKESFVIKSSDYQFVELIDASGRVVFSSSIEDELIVDADSFKSGVYIVRLSGNDKSELRKIIIK